MSKNISDTRVVVSSLLVSAADVVLNVLVAMLTGSAVMLSQSLQGLSDFTTSAILYKGTKQSRRTANDKYQFGFGREVFFWVLMSSVVMFIGTGGLSLYFGYHQIITPEPVHHIWAALATLFISLIYNSFAFWLSFRRLSTLDATRSWWQLLVSSSIAETKATFIINFLAALASVLGLIAFGLFALTGNAQFDGWGSVIIGITMMITAALLIQDMRGLLVGKAVDIKIRQRIIDAAQSVPGVITVLDLRTMYLGSGKKFAILELHLQDGLVTDQIEAITDTVKQVVQTNIPEVHHIQVEVESPEAT